MRHAEHFTALAEAHARSSFGWLRREDLDWFDREHGNLRSALERVAETQSELEPRLVDARFSFWMHGGHWLEGGRRTQSVLGRIGGEAPLLRGRALRQAAAFARRRGDAARGKVYAEEALEIHRGLGTGGEELFWTPCTSASAS